MNIVLIGYGKMGKAIEIIAKNRNHNIVEIINRNENHKINNSLAKKCDIAIEFTTPTESEDNILKCLENKISIVTGTTGWNYNKEKIINLCNKNKIAFFYSSNFSIGMNIFFEINKKLAELIDKYDSYQVSIEETHHIHKLDKPSGTAITLAKDIIHNTKKYSSVPKNNEEIIKELSINSIREAEVFGNHKVTWNNNVDSITIEHDAKSRVGFALGAVLASEFIKDKIGILSMQDLLNLN